MGKKILALCSTCTPRSSGGCIRDCLRAIFASNDTIFSSRNTLLVMIPRIRICPGACEFTRVSMLLLCKIQCWIE